MSDQDAADIMLYVNAQERADFDLDKGLLPKEKMGYYKRSEAPMFWQKSTLLKAILKIWV